MENPVLAGEIFSKRTKKFLKKFARRGIHNIASLKKPGVLNYGTIKWKWNKSLTFAAGIARCCFTQSALEIWFWGVVVLRVFREFNYGRDLFIKICTRSVVTLLLFLYEFVWISLYYKILKNASSKWRCI